MSYFTIKDTENINSQIKKIHDEKIAEEKQRRIEKEEIAKKTLFAVDCYFNALKELPKFSKDIGIVKESVFDSIEEHLPLKKNLLEELIVITECYKVYTSGFIIKFTVKDYKNSYWTNSIRSKEKKQVITNYDMREWVKYKVKENMPQIMSRVVKETPKSYDFSPFRFINAVYSMPLYPKKFYFFACDGFEYRKNSESLYLIHSIKTDDEIKERVKTYFLNKLLNIKKKSINPPVIK